MYRQLPEFWFNLKASSGALSICVSSSHLSLTHVVGAMIVVDMTEPDVGMSGKQKGALSCPRYANASAAAKAISYQQPIGTATFETIMVITAILESRRGGAMILGS